MAPVEGRCKIDLLKTFGGLINVSIDWSQEKTRPLDAGDHQIRASRLEFLFLCGSSSQSALFSNISVFLLLRREKYIVSSYFLRSRKLSIDYRNAEVQKYFPS